MKGLYYFILCVFIVRVTFAAFPYDSDYIHWYKFYPDQVATFQWWFWRLMVFLVEAVFIYGMRGIAYETDPAKKYQCVKMTTLLLGIQSWYVLEYLFHYTSVWITWEQINKGLGQLDLSFRFDGDKKSGLSSHILTMAIFAYFGWSDD
jgi:hypothetical protein